MPTTISERVHRLMETGLFSDIEFLISSEGHTGKVKGHKAIFAISSPVFEALLFGPNRTIGDEIKIKDVELEAFKALKKFVYTDKIKFDSIHEASSVYKLADLYKLPDLAKKAEEYLSDNVRAETVCSLLKFSKDQQKHSIEKKCLDYLKKDTASVLSSNGFLNCGLDLVTMIVDESDLNIDEIDLFSAIENWAKRKMGIEDKIPGNDVWLLKDIFAKIRFLAMTADEFASGPGKSKLLTLEEKYCIIMNINVHGSVPLPDRFCTSRISRKKEKDAMLPVCPPVSLSNASGMSMPNETDNMLSTASSDDSEKASHSSSSRKMKEILPFTASSDPNFYHPFTTQNVFNDNGKCIGVNVRWRTNAVFSKQVPVPDLSFLPEWISPRFLVNNHPFRLRLYSVKDYKGIERLNIRLICDSAYEAYGHQWSCSVAFTLKIHRKNGSPRITGNSCNFHMKSSWCSVESVPWTKLVDEGYISDDTILIEMMVKSSL